MSHDNVNLSTCGFNEQIPFDRMCGKGKSVIAYTVKYKKSVFLT